MPACSFLRAFAPLVWFQQEEEEDSPDPWAALADGRLSIRRQAGRARAGPRPLLLLPAPASSAAACGGGVRAVDSPQVFLLVSYPVSVPRPSPHSAPCKW